MISTKVRLIIFFAVKDGEVLYSELRHLAKPYFWVYLWGCSQMRLAFASVAWVKEIALPSVSGHHSVYWWLNKTKRQRKGRICSFFLTVELRRLSSSLGLEITSSVLLVLRLSSLNWNYTTAFLGLHLGCKEYNWSDFSIDHLVMLMCRVFSCVVGRGYLLFPCLSERQFKF